MNLRDQVESLLPNWQSWYPTVFDAAVDLGILRARVCPPGSLLLSQRHASIYNEAVQAFREQWSVAEPEGEEQAEGVANGVTSPIGDDEAHRDAQESNSDPFLSPVTRHASRTPR